MELTPKNVESMDVHMLMSIVNMKLRNEYDSVHAMCASYDIDEQALVARLHGADYDYDSATNQFH